MPGSTSRGTGETFETRERAFCFKISVDPLDQCPSLDVKCIQTEGPCELPILEISQRHNGNHTGYTFDEAEREEGHVKFPRKNQGDSETLHQNQGSLGIV